MSSFDEVDVVGISSVFISVLSRGVVDRWKKKSEEKKKRVLWSPLFFREKKC